MLPHLEVQVEAAVVAESGQSGVARGIAQLLPQFLVGLREGNLTKRRGSDLRIVVSCTSEVAHDRKRNDCVRVADLGVQASAEVLPQLSQRAVRAA